MLSVEIDIRATTSIRTLEFIWGNFSSFHFNPLRLFEALDIMVLATVLTVDMKITGGELKNGRFLY